MVNRGLVIALAKEPFREWLLSLPDQRDMPLELHYSHLLS